MQTHFVMLGEECPQYILVDYMNMISQAFVVLFSLERENLL